jgi:branched-chain amino acid transport system permease protein
MTAYLISMATYAGFFMILALALNLQWGMTGMVNFGIAGFYALGAYTSGLLTVKAGSRDQPARCV